MSTLQEQNKATMRRFVEEYQTRNNVAVADELLADNFVDHSASPGVQPAKEGVKMLFSMFHAAFPDFRAVIHHQVADGDRVVTHKIFYGTHRGELMGIPPTGKQVTITVIDELRLENGQLAEHWNAVDQFGMLQQLGVIPAPQS